MIWRPAVRWVCGRPAGGLEQGARGGRQGCGRGRSEGQHSDVCTRSSKCTAPDRPNKAGRQLSSWQEQMGCPAHHGAAGSRALLSPAQPVTAARPLGTACVEGAAAQQRWPSPPAPPPAPSRPPPSWRPAAAALWLSRCARSARAPGLPGRRRRRLPPSAAGLRALQNGPTCVGCSCSRRR